MKIFSLYSEDYPVAPSAGATYLLADSALQKQNKPFFLPDDGAPYAGYAALAFPVTRLGKTINRRFASRYYSSVHPVLMIRAEGYAEKLRNEGKLLTDAFSFDGAINMGTTADGDSVIWRNGQDYAECLIADILPLLNEWIEILSSRNTLRTGDLLVYPIGRLTKQLKENMNIEAYSKNESLLKFNIK